MEDIVLDALGNKSRRTILNLVKANPRSAGSIANEFSESFSAISQHLRILKEAHLVRETRSGRERIYEIDPKGFKQVVNWIAEFESFWSEKLDALDHVIKKRRSSK